MPLRHAILEAKKPPYLNLPHATSPSSIPWSPLSLHLSHPEIRITSSLIFTLPNLLLQTLQNSESRACCQL